MNLLDEKGIAAKDVIGIDAKYMQLNSAFKDTLERYILDFEPSPEIALDSPERRSA